MGNAESSSSGGGGGGRKSSRKSRKNGTDDVADRAKKALGDVQATVQAQIKQLEENDHPAAHFLDSVCGGYIDERDRRGRRSDSFYSDYGSDEDDDDRTYSEDETTATDYKDKRGRSKRRDDPSTGGDTASYLESDYEPEDRRSSRKKKSSASFESEDEYSKGTKSDLASQATEDVPKSKAASASANQPKPLASAFAKRCYFTKSGIGSSTQHYEGLTLTGNVVLMLATAMKLKGCPTICDEDLRRVEQTYPNQFSRLPDELLLSSGWRRISKYCHFSTKPIPDGVPFFHSKQRLHPTGGYYFLLAAAVGMVRPSDVEPLNRDTLVLLETDFPSGCDAAPKMLVEDPDQWTLVDKFCFFSGGPINTDEDVYYRADFDGNPIYMLAFLSPSLTPNELYKLDEMGEEGPGLKSVMQVEEVESVYDLTDRDFDDLRQYHLGPCRALPQYILQPTAWTKVLPPHFLEAREQALQRAQEYEMATHGGVGVQQGSPMQPVQNARASVGAIRQIPDHGANYAQPADGMAPPEGMDQQQHAMQMQMQMQQMGIPGDETGMPSQMNPGIPDSGAMMMQQQYQQHPDQYQQQEAPMDEGMVAPNGQMQMEDQPPSLSQVENQPENQAYYPSNQQGMMNGMNPHQDPQSNMNEYPPMDYNYGGQGNGYQNQQMQMGGYEHQHPGEQMGGYHPDQQGMNGYGNMDPGMNMNGYDDPASPNYGQGQFSPAQYSESQYDDGQQYQHPEMQGMAYDQDPAMHQDPNSQYYDQHGMPIQNDQYYVDGQMLNDQGYDQQPYSPDDNGNGYFSPDHGEVHMQPDDEADANPISPQTQDSSVPYNYSADATEDPEPSLGPISPANESEVNPRSEFSVQSQAMKGARELLKRNRQKRLEMVARQANSDPSAESRDGPGVQDYASPKSEASAATWESSSEVTESVLSGTSSAWTESSDAPGRSSRRALILQMAKARMKGNKGSGSSVAGDTPRSEIMGTYSITEEEKKLDGSIEDEEEEPIIEDNATDIDIAGDLD